MPVKTVTIQVTALTDAANRQIAATGAYFEKLRQANPVELKVKLDSAQALAESKILAKEMSQTVTDQLKLDSGGGGLGRLFKGGSGAGAGLPGVAGSIPGIGSLSPAAAGAGAAAILTALPFAAQIAAGAITTVLGGALAGIGVYAASSNKQVTAAFESMKAAADKDFSGIGNPFVASLTGIYKTVQTVMPGIAKTFKEATAPIAAPLEALGKALVKAFAGPSVAESIKAVGQAFGSLLKVITPTVGTDIAMIATGITAIANAVKKNPKPFADFVLFLSAVTEATFLIIAALTDVATYIEGHFVNAFKRAGHDAQGAWDALWADTVGQAQKGVAAVAGWFGKLPGEIVAAVGNLGRILWNAGAAIIGGLWDGLKSALGPMLGWVSSIGGMIAHLKGPLDYDRKLLFPHGMAIMGGLQAGLAAGWAPVVSQLSGYTAAIGYPAPLAGAAAGYGARPGVPAGAPGQTNMLLQELIAAVAVVNASIRTLTGVTAKGPAVMGAALAGGNRVQLYKALYP